MKLKFLGTGGVLGTPVWNCNCKTCSSGNERNNRLRPSFLIQLETVNIIIDFGKDFYQQLLKYSIPQFDYAFLTHAHQDHMDGQEQFVIAGDCQVSMPKNVLEKFREKTNEKRLAARNPKLRIREFSLFEVDGFSIDSVKLSHQKDYDVVNCPCYGYVFRSKNFSFAYVGDNNDVLEPEKLHNLDLLISDGNCMENNNLGHIGIIEGIEKQYKAFNPKRMIFTHLSHEVEYDGACEYVKPFGGVEIAYDGMEIEF